MRYEGNAFRQHRNRRKMTIRCRVLVFGFLASMATVCPAAETDDFAAVLRARYDIAWPS